MKKTNFYLLWVIFIFSCNNYNSNNIKAEKPKSEKSVEVRQFPSNQNLWIDFYAGMNRKEIKEILKRKIGNSEFFIKKRNVKDYWKIDKDHLNSISIKNVDSLDAFDGFDRIYYKFSNSNNTFYAKVDFHFSTYSSLSSITLILPDYMPRHESNIRVIEREFEQGKKLSNSIKQMYKKKYGNPKIDIGQKNKMNEQYYKVKNAKLIYNQNVHYFEDIYRYRNNDDNKLVSIASSIKSVFIIYSLYSDYLENIKKNKKKLMNEENQENNTYQKTFESI